MEIQGWAMQEVGKPLVAHNFESGALEADSVLVRVAGCGVCHTDLGYLFDGVPMRRDMPVVLGHEIAGEVVETGADATNLMGSKVVVPAVIPCLDCEACNKGRTGICKKQIFVGNNIHGGFASHVVVPARGLCEVPSDISVPLEELSVIADAVTTPLNAVVTSGLQAEQVAVFVGAGGVGAFGIQVAKATGAHVIALDVDDERLALVAEHGADVTVNTRDLSPKDLKKQLRTLAREKGWATQEWVIFETSGTAPGQDTAFALVNFGATLMVVGYTTDKVSVRLSNLMAFEARAIGVWGCPPALYGKAVELVHEGKVKIGPFVEKHSMSHVNELLNDLHNRRIKKRVVLVP